MNLSKDQLKQLISLSMQAGIPVPAHAIASSTIFAANRQAPTPYLEDLDDGRVYGKFRPQNMNTAPAAGCAPLH